MTINKYIVSVFAVLLLAFNSYAQEKVTVTGVVRDKTGSIPSATVVVVNQNTNTTTINGEVYTAAKKFNQK